MENATKTKLNVLEILQKLSWIIDRSRKNTKLPTLFKGQTLSLTTYEWNKCGVCFKLFWRSLLMRVPILASKRTCTQARLIRDCLLLRNLVEGVGNKLGLLCKGTCNLNHDVPVQQISIFFCNHVLFQNRVSTIWEEKIPLFYFKC